MELHKAGFIKAKELVKAGNFNAVAEYPGAPDGLAAEYHLGVEGTKHFYPFAADPDGTMRLYTQALTLAGADQDCPDDVLGAIERLEEMAKDIEPNGKTDNSPAPATGGGNKPGEEAGTTVDHQTTRENENAGDPPEPPEEVSSPELQARMTKDGLVRRALFKLDRRTVDMEARTVELGFSSETPVRRWGYMEVLDHGRGSIDMSRLKDGAALLLNHDTDKHIGVTERAWIESRRGRAIVRFSKHSDLAEQVLREVEDGIRTGVSVGYQIDPRRVKEEPPTEEGGAPTFRMKGWAPHEITIASVPADPKGSGIGRSLDVQPPPEGRTIKMGDEHKEPAQPEFDRAAEAKKVQKEELTRMDEIRSMGDTHKLPKLAEKLIREHTPLTEARIAILDELAKQGDRGVEKATKDAEDIGLSKKEAGNFRYQKLIAHMANPSNQTLRNEAGFELRAIEAAEERTAPGKGVAIPAEVLRRDLIVGDDSYGGYTTSDDFRGSSFIDLLKPNTVMMDICDLLTGLTGDVVLPTAEGGFTAYFVGELEALTKSTATFGQRRATPFTLGAYTELSTLLLDQTSIDMELWIRRELTRSVGVAVDLKSIVGAGGSEPLGLTNVAGVNSVSCGSPNGGNPTWAKTVELETGIATANADMASQRILTNPGVRGYWKTTPKVSGTAGMIWESDNTVNGYPVSISTQVPNDGTEGSGSNLSTIIQGAFSMFSLLFWGTFRLQVNPYSLDTTDAVRVVCYNRFDTMCRHPEAFNIASDCITA